MSISQNGDSVVAGGSVKLINPVADASNSDESQIDKQERIGGSGQAMRESLR